MSEHHLSWYCARRIMRSCSHSDRALPPISRKATARHFSRICNLETTDCDSFATRMGEQIRSLFDHPDPPRKKQGSDPKSEGGLCICHEVPSKGSFTTCCLLAAGTMIMMAVVLWVLMFLWISLFLRLMVRILEVGDFQFMALSCKCCPN